MLLVESVAGVPTLVFLFLARYSIVDAAQIIISYVFGWYRSGFKGHFVAAF
jgi:hypothetical protein